VTRLHLLQSGPRQTRSRWEISGRRAAHVASIQFVKITARSMKFLKFREMFSRPRIVGQLLHCGCQDCVNLSVSSAGRIPVRRNSTSNGISSLRSRRRRGSRWEKTFKAEIKGRRENTLSETICARFRLVARNESHVDPFAFCVLPNRSNSCSCRKRAAVFCLQLRWDIADLVEEEGFPYPPVRKRPILRVIAPVNAPRSWPKSFAFQQPQRKSPHKLSFTKFRVFRWLRVWIALRNQLLACCRFSPSSSTVESVGGYCLHVSQPRSSAPHSAPIIPSNARGMDSSVAGEASLSGTASSNRTI